MSTIFQLRSLPTGKQHSSRGDIRETIIVYSYRSSPYDLHNAFAPIRWYYHVMCWMYGNDYDPFATTQTEGLHPLLVSMKYHQNKIRNLYFGGMYTIPPLLIALVIHKIVTKRYYSKMKK